MELDGTVRFIHLAAALIALCVATASLYAWTLRMEAVERENVWNLDRLDGILKEQSRALQARGFESPMLLPYYGTSELEKPADLRNRASKFFREHPAGFGVLSIGRVGAYPLLMAQEFAALGPVLRDRKVVVCISPSWFYFRDLIDSHYAGNFAPLPANELAFSTRLSWSIKQRLARRILAYPETLRRVPVAALALAQMGSEGWWHRLAYWLIFPFGRLETLIMELQDHFELLLAIEGPGSAPRDGSPASGDALDWDRLLAAARVEAGESPVPPPSPPEFDRSPGPHDAEFLANVEHSNQWEDLDLMFEVLDKLGAHPLALSVPQNSLYAQQKGFSRAAREVVYRRLREVARRHNIPILDHAAFDGDMHFLADRHDHLSDLGWLYFCKAIDEFYHGRIAAPR